MNFQFPFDTICIATGAPEWMKALVGDPDLKEFMNRNLEDITVLRTLMAKADQL